LLAWIYEKLHDWTDGYPWTDDEILTWISIYWFSQAGAPASLRIYYEATHTSAETTRERVQQYIGRVKLGLCYAPKVCGCFPTVIRYGLWWNSGFIRFASETQPDQHMLI
jgi:hypothetical protein